MPDWLSAEASTFATVDLTEPSDVQTVFQTTSQDDIDALIIGVRAPLVTGCGNHEKLLLGIESLIKTVVEKGAKRVIHISSVAAVDHLREQINAEEDDPLPPLEEYKGSYDICSNEKVKNSSRKLVATKSDTFICD